MCTIVRRFTLSEFLILTSTINSSFICKPLFLSLGRGVSVELLIKPSLSNAILHVRKVPSFVGREMLNLLNTDSRRANVPKRSNTEGLDTSSGFSSSTSKVICYDIAFYPFPLVEIRTGSCDEYPNPIIGISIA